MEPSKYVRTYSSDQEIEVYRELERALDDSPVSSGERLGNLGLFLTRASLARLLFMHDLYLKIINVPGCIMELGCHWGQNLALFSTLRTIYEPQNVSRTIIGFDTFEGYQASSEADGPAIARAVTSNVGAVGEDYEQALDRILDCHNRLGQRAHIKKHDLVKGNVSDTLPAYLDAHPEMIIALAYLDIGLYQPTRDALEALKPRMAKGSIIGLDHLGMPDVPGDTRAVLEVLGLAHRYVRDPRVPYQSYVIIE